MINSPQEIFPTLRYRDASTALKWLQNAFGFTEEVVYRDDNEIITHAVLRYGASMIMFGQHSPEGWLGGSAPDPLASTVSIYVAVADPDAHYDRAVAAGAQIMRPLVDQEYGSRDYSARDLEGNLWSFGTYNPTIPTAHS